MSIHFSPEQESAMKLFRAGQNMCVIGPGGSGKSFLIHSMFKDAQQRKQKVAVTALTGCAAYLLVETGARTIHSWSGIYRFQEKEITPSLI